MSINGRFWVSTEADVWSLYAHCWDQAFRAAVRGARRKCEIRRTELPDAYRSVLNYKLVPDIELIPAFFLLRHTLELHLKARLVRLGQPSPTKAHLQVEHRLASLLKEVLRQAPGSISKDVQDLIMGVHDLDPRGMDFRYPSDVGYKRLTKGLPLVEKATELLRRASNLWADWRKL